MELSMDFFSFLTEDSFFASFRVVKLLGQGGMGAVYLAEQQNPKRKVAIKFLLSMQSAISSERFYREMELIAQLEHPNIIKSYQAGLHQGIPYIVMEYLDGKMWNDWVKKDCPSLQEKIKAFWQIVKAVGYAHSKGIIHRDLKPENIMILSDGKAVLMDFGIGKNLNESYQKKLTQSAEILGTPRYMSPEQAENSRKCNELSDIYSLGAILYEIATQNFMIQGENTNEILYRIAFDIPHLPSNICPEVDKNLESIILKATAKSSKDRYKNAQEMAMDLRRWQEGKRVKAKAARSMRRVKWFAQRHFLLVFVFSALFLLSILTISGYYAIKAYSSHIQLSESEIIKISLENIDSFLKENLYSMAFGVSQDLFSKTKIFKQNMLQSVFLAKEYEASLEWLNTDKARSSFPQEKIAYYKAIAFYEIAIKKLRGQNPDNKNEISQLKESLSLLDSLSRGNEKQVLEWQQDIAYPMDIFCTLGMIEYHVWNQTREKRKDEKSLKELQGVLEKLEKGKYSDVYKRIVLQARANIAFFLAKEKFSGYTKDQYISFFSQAIENAPEDADLYQKRAEIKLLFSEPYYSIESDCFFSLRFAPRDIRPFLFIQKAFLETKIEENVLPDIRRFMDFWLFSQHYHEKLHRQYPDVVLWQEKWNESYEKWAKFSIPRIEKKNFENYYIRLLEKYEKTSSEYIQKITEDKLLELSLIQDTSLLLELFLQKSSSKKIKLEELRKQIQKYREFAPFASVVVSLCQLYLNNSGKLSKSQLQQIGWENVEKAYHGILICQAFPKGYTQDNIFALRYLAAQALLVLGTPEAYILLCSSQKSKDILVSFSSAMVLKEKGHPYSNSILEKMFEAKNSFLAILTALEQYPEDSAISLEVQKFLNKEVCAEIRLSAARLFLNSKDGESSLKENARKIFRDVLYDSKIDSKYKRYALRWFWENYKETNQEYIEKDLQNLIKFLQDGDIFLAQMAAIMAGHNFVLFQKKELQEKKEEIVRLLKEKSDSQDEQLRFSCILALGRLEEMQILRDILLKKVDLVSFFTFASSIWGLSRQGGELLKGWESKVLNADIVTTLKRLISGEDPYLRFNLLCTIGLLNRVEKNIKNFFCNILEEQLEKKLEKKDILGTFYGLMLLKQTRYLKKVENFLDIKNGDFLNYLSAAVISYIRCEKQPERWIAWCKELTHAPHKQGASYGYYYQIISGMKREDEYPIWEDWGLPLRQREFHKFRLKNSILKLYYDCYPFGYSLPSDFQKGMEQCSVFLKLNKMKNQIKIWIEEGKNFSSQKNEAFRKCYFLIRLEQLYHQLNFCDYLWEDIRFQYEKAFIASEAGEFFLACSILEKMIQRFSHVHSEELYIYLSGKLLLSECYFKTGKIQQARECLETLLSQENPCQEAFFLRGLISLEEARKKKSISLYQNALKDFIAYSIHDVYHIETLVYQAICIIEMKQLQGKNIEEITMQNEEEILSFIEKKVQREIQNIFWRTNLLYKNHDKYVFYHFADCLGYQRILSLVYFTRARIKAWEGKQDDALMFLEKAYQYHHSMVPLHKNEFNTERPVWKEKLIAIDSPFEKKNLSRYRELRAILPGFLKNRQE